VAKDHPFLEADSLQSLFRRLHALNRCATMKLDAHHTHHSTSHSKSVSIDASRCLSSITNDYWIGGREGGGGTFQGMEALRGTRHSM